LKFRGKTTPILGHTFSCNRANVRMESGLPITLDGSCHGRTVLPKSWKHHERSRAPGWHLARHHLLRLAAWRTIERRHRLPAVHSCRCNRGVHPSVDHSRQPVSRGSPRAATAQTACGAADLRTRFTACCRTRTLRYPALTPFFPLKSKTLMATQTHIVSVGVNAGRVPSITARPTPDEKRRFAELASSRGMSESTLALIGIRSLLDSNGPPARWVEEPAPATDRITIRLRPGDHQVIARRA